MSGDWVPGADLQRAAVGLLSTAEAQGHSWLLQKHLDVRVLDQSELLLGLVKLLLLPPDVGLQNLCHCSDWSLMVWDMLNCAGNYAGVGEGRGGRWVLQKV